MALSKKLRNAYCEKSTGSKDGEYYFTKGHGVMAFAEVLDRMGLEFDWMALQQMPGDNGRKTVDVRECDEACEGTGRVVGSALITWYQMPSGRYEMISYLG